MKTLRGLLGVLTIVAFAPSVHAQQALWGASLRLVPQSSTPGNCSNLGVCLWSPSDGTLNIGKTSSLFLSVASAAPNSAVLIFNDGESASAGAAGTGVLRYNNLSHAFEQSLNGGAFQSLGTGNWTFSGNNADLSGAGTMGFCLVTCTAATLGHSGMTTTFPGPLALPSSAAIDSSGDFLGRGVFNTAGSFGIRFFNGYNEVNSANIAATSDNTLQNGVASIEWSATWSYLFSSKLGSPLSDAATLAPLTMVTHTTGTGTTVTNITVPITGFIGTIVLITNSAITFGSGGNIATTGQITTTPGQQYFCTYDGTSWYIK